MSTIDYTRPSHVHIMSALTLYQDRSRRAEQTVSERIREHLFGTLVNEAFGTGCWCCGIWKPTVHWRRSNTAYVHEASNWTWVCPECYADDCEHWAELWAEYYGGRL